MEKDFSKYHIPDSEFVFKNKYVFQFVKRSFDIFASLLAIVLLLLLFIIVALVVKCYDGGPVFFRQERVGKNGKIFKMIKFRSMKINAEDELDNLMSKNEASGPLFKIKDDPRITKPGKFLRKTSIDELPQLFNILGGSMSFVGPRPCLEREVKEYKYESDKWKLLVKPGLTCIEFPENLTLNSFSIICPL